MKSRPILFSGPMVRAILEERKTQTRRALPHQPEIANPKPIWGKSARGMPGVNWYQTEDDRLEMSSGDISVIWKPCRYGVPGDTLWVRETHFEQNGAQDKHGMFNSAGISYSADCGSTMVDYLRQSGAIQRPSIFMRRIHSRITLRITDVRVERLQDISEEDAKAEGTEPADCCHAHYHGYRLLWESINGKGSWERNDWVWAVSFERVK